MTAPSHGMQWVRVCTVEEIAIGTAKRVDRPHAPPIAIYRTDRGFFATEDTCTHGIASLSEGTLDGEIIECPFHGGAFNICTGTPESSPCTVALKLYKTEVRGEDIYLDIAEK